MLFRAQWHIIEKYNLMTGEKISPLIIGVMRTNDAERHYRFDYNWTDEAVTVQARATHIDPKYTKWLLVARREALSCLPTTLVKATSRHFAFLFLRTDDEYTMAKLAFNFPEPGDIPLAWIEEDLVK